MPGFDSKAEGCLYCGSSAWNTCKHREGRTNRPDGKEKADKRISGGGQYNRKRLK